MKILGAVFIAILSLNVYSAQSNDNVLEFTNWGAPVCNVQLSVVVSNNVITIDSMTILHCCIKNSSTNIVQFGDTGAPIYDSNVSLLDSSEKIFDLTPTNRFPRSIYMNISVRINPEQTYEWKIPIHIQKDFEFGTYKLKVKRIIWISGKRYDLESNLQEVQIK
ncbi:MAG TPA: hypothetical protein VIK59_08985 [Verrucomicrobiae bacterium]